MKRLRVANRLLRVAFAACALSICHSLPGCSSGASNNGWIKLPADEGFTRWRRDHSGWTICADATLDPDSLGCITELKGSGVLVARGGERSNNLLSQEEYQDIEVKLEFMIPRGSNSGVKLNGLYEVQILDSYGVEHPKADDCGGIYPRADGPPHHYIDEGLPPRINAARPAGEWQTLEIVFLSPRFDAAGKKIANACFISIVLNGQAIHENKDLAWPTGGAWRVLPEVPKGPLLLQGDHGPAAFRNIVVRRLGQNELPSMQ